MTDIDFSYHALVSNIIKRVLLLAGKLAGYKGFAVLVATMLLCRDIIGEAAWASVVISALCGAVVPKTFSNIGVKENENDDYSYGGRAAGTAYKPSPSCGKAVSEGKKRIRNAVESAGRRADSGTGEDS